MPFFVISGTAPIGDFVRRPSTTNLLLGLIALLLAGLLLRPLWTAPVVSADTGQPYPLFIEPGVSMLRAPDGSRQVFGKVAIDMRTGTVWGFPTTTQDPYPVNAVESKPQTSRPFVLGRYALEDTAK